MQGCREMGGVHIQRIEKSTTLDQVWHGFMASEAPWFRWFGAAKVCKAATPSLVAGSVTSRHQPLQNVTFAPTVTLRPIKGAAVLMKEVCA